jgi:GTP-binding protein
MFVDKVQVTIEAGNGGDGIVSWRHEKFVDRGGPDGGDGGHGGDVIVQASRNQNTLAAFRYKKLLKAEPGKPGGKSRKHGRSGEDLVVPVPVGTVVMDAKENVIADLAHDGDEAVIATGGNGGFGNAHFTSSTRRSPKVAEKGERGEHVNATFELKMIADVGLVGLPNAGKSTLLSVISNAKPEIANYPFTTLVPNLGVVDIDGRSSLLVADIPGLIEGASEGKGLGDEFLRHVERTAVLIHLIDVFSEDIATDYKTIQQELKQYQVDLSVKPQIVALTKTEGLDAKVVAKTLMALKKVVPKGTPLLTISSQSGEGVKELLYEAGRQVDAARRVKQETEDADALPVFRLPEDDSSWKVEKTDDGYTVTGRKIERFAGRTNADNEDGVKRLRDIMTKMGIMRELTRKGIEPGQKIRLGEPAIFTLEY